MAPRISVSPALTMSAARESVAGPKAAACCAHPLELVLGHVAQPRPGALGHRRDDDQVAQPFQQVLGEAARVEPGLDHPVDRAERRGAVAGGERVDSRRSGRRR